MKNLFAEPVGAEEDKLEEIATNLYKRIAEETEKLLEQQLGALGVDHKDHEAIIKGGFQKTVFPHDSKALAMYEYKGRKILGVRIADNDMGIEFETPVLENLEETEAFGENTESQEEDQDV